MRLRAIAPFLLLLATLPAFSGSPVRGGMATYLSFNPTSSQYNLTMPMVYELPDPAVFGPGPYPVFVWVPGTFEVLADPLSLVLINEMSKRGFLSVSVQYSNVELAQTCQAYTTRAQGIFDVKRSTSAISTICNLPVASCAKGVVTSGISQGGILAVLGRNYAPQVQAVYAMSTGAYNGLGVDLASCMKKTNTAIPANRLMIVNGQADPAFGSQNSTQTASGITCPDGTAQCWSPDGSGAGWIIVQNSQVTDGVADHCYIDVSGCNDHFDPHWYLPSVNNWSLKPNLDWLATFGTHRVMSPNGQ